MKVLGINGSPRKKGNTHFLLNQFMAQMQERGHETRILEAPRLDIKMCIGCGKCEREGVCTFSNDEFTRIVLPELIESDLVVLSSPVYFFGFPAALKALIDRVQVLWSRKYVLKTNSYASRNRQGLLLAAGATKGKNLFDGLKLTARYFYDAADINYAGELCYRGMENSDEMENHPTAVEDIKALASRF